MAASRRTCLDCLENHPHHSRGLCTTCYARRERAGTLTERPPLVRGTASLMSVVEGLTYRRLDHWTTLGYLHADEANPGSGYARTWPESEKRVAATMARLTAAGLSVAAAHRAARGETELAPGIRIVVDEPAAVA